jgi:GTP cyclohydrolase I
MSPSQDPLLSWLRDTVGVAQDGIAEIEAATQEKPERIPNAYRQLFQGYEVKPSELLAYRVSGTKGRPFGEVWAREIPFLSFCAHHFLPFTGTVSVAYLPGNGLLGLGKLPRLVQCRAQRFQLQERLMVEIVEDLIEFGGAKWARAESTARHACLCYRGPREPSSETFTTYEAGERQ